MTFLTFDLNYLLSLVIDWIDIEVLELIGFIDLRIRNLLIELVVGRDIGIWLDLRKKIEVLLRKLTCMLILSEL
jgi:hypothetical protein